jgi:hypothetical protein
LSLEKPLIKPPEAVKLPKMISDDPSLSEEDKEIIRNVELLLMIEEFEASKTYRLETQEEYDKRMRERKKK